VIYGSKSSPAFGPCGEDLFCGLHHQENEGFVGEETESEYLELRGYSQGTGLAWGRRYSCREAGSERFLGDFLLSTETSSCAEGGTGTAPFRTMSTAATFLP